MKKTCTTLLATTMLAGIASAAAMEKPEASIPFVNLNQSIRSWQADGRQGIWIQDAKRQWYYAKLATTCIGLDFAVRVGFQTRSSNTLDRFGSIVVPNEGSCQITSLTESSAPVDEKKSHKVEDSASK